MGGWFDSHCHVQEEYVSGRDSGDPDEAGRPAGAAQVEAVLARAADAGVDRLICIGTGAATSQQALGVARETACGSAPPRAWATVGLHPHEASEGVDEVAALLARALGEEDGVVVAVGECGLDYYYEHSPKDAQRAAFAAQIALAHAHDLALVIHARDAWDDLFDVLHAEGVPERTVLHCFTGGPDEVERCLRAGMYVSFSGIVTFKNAADVRAAAARCPLDRLLVETDSPFLAPVPHRGRTNEPSYLPLVGEALATVKGCSVDEIRERTALSTAMVFSTAR
ncbi:MAG TPA: TatD family hydrolase [Gemmatimonadales bacterium]|nr:TatD family hydrolase [Gemmatimonadales bacterium]